MTKRKTEYWLIPPKVYAEIVASMQNILETYEQLYDTPVLVACMDDQPVRLLKETRFAATAKREHPCWVDYELEPDHRGGFDVEPLPDRT